MPPRRPGPGSGFTRCGSSREHLASSEHRCHRQWRLAPERDRTCGGELPRPRFQGPGEPGDDWQRDRRFLGDFLLCGAGVVGELFQGQPDVGKKRGAWSGGDLKGFRVQVPDEGTSGFLRLGFPFLRPWTSLSLNPARGGLLIAFEHPPSPSCLFFGGARRRKTKMPPSFSLSFRKNAAPTPRT